MSNATATENENEKESFSATASEDEEVGLPLARERRAGAPKRPATAYMFFANDQRDSVRVDTANTGFGHVGKVLGERWNALDDRGREPYEAKAREDRVRYEREMVRFDAEVKAKARED